MAALAFGAVVLLLLLWAAKSFAKADPKKAARLVRYFGGLAALAFAGFLALRGEFVLAVPIGAAGLGLLGWMSLPSAIFGRPPWGGPGRASRVRTAFLEVELDRHTGAMRGRFLAGRYAGTALDALDPPALIAVLREIDDDSRRLLIAYLDRRAPGWREHAQDDAASRRRGGAPASKMTEEEAYQILGLQSGASAEEIARAHRSLMKKLHPDQGGSTYLAARVNEAKEVLLRRHR
jgi:hypothetical protein